MTNCDYMCNTKQYILLFGMLLAVFVLKGTAVRTEVTEPTFRDVGNNVTVNRGETAVLRCLVDSLGPKTVVWRKEANVVPLAVGSWIYTSDRDMSIDHREFGNSTTQWNLIIRRPQPYQSGTYVCQISAARDYTYQVELHLNVPAAANAVEIYGTEYVRKYSRIELTCNATRGTRAPDGIDWFHMGQKLDMNDDEKWQGRLLVTKYQPEIHGKSLISHVVIERSRLSDSGEYICRSSDLRLASVSVRVING